MKKTALHFRKLHKFLMIFLGLQFVLWSFSGFYMVVMNIDFIHGDHLVKAPLPLALSDKPSISFVELLQKHPKATNLKLTTLGQENVYQFSVNGLPHLVLASSGESLLPFTKEDIEKLVSVQSNISNDITIKNLQLLTDVAPAELSSRRLPAWQVTFDDVAASTLYLSSTTGQVITKRHNYWRIFDFVWMLHIMDYENREDITNWLLFIFSLTGIFSCLSGLYLVGYRFRFHRKLSLLFTKSKSQHATAKTFKSNG